MKNTIASATLFVVLSLPFAVTSWSQDAGQANYTCQVPEIYDDVQYCDGTPVEIVRRVERQVVVEVTEYVDVPVEVVRQVERQVPVEVVQYVDVPVEVVRQVERQVPVEVVQYVDVPVEVVRQVERQVPVEVVQYVDVPVEVVRQVERQVPVEVLQYVDVPVSTCTNSVAHDQRSYPCSGQITTCDVRPGTVCALK